MLQLISKNLVTLYLLLEPLIPLSPYLQTLTCFSIFTNKMDMKKNNVSILNILCKTSLILITFRLVVLMIKEITMLPHPTKICKSLNQSHAKS